MLELKDTKELMLSEDFKDRMKAEYWQTKTRYDRLHDMVVKYEAGTLEFEPTCSLKMLKSQLSAMGKYLYVLEVRTQIDGVEL